MRLILFLLLFVTHQVSASSATPIPFATHTLFIFLDDHEQKYGPVARDCTQAILQHVPMILVSTSLLNKVLSDIYPKLKLTFEEKFWVLKQASKYMTLMLGANAPADTGLNVADMPVTNIKEITSYSAATMSPEDYFLKDFESIFAKRPRPEMPRWAFYLDGHGALGSTTASLPNAQFRELLTFLTKKLVTKFFAYTTCFATGTNSNEIYRNLSGQIAQHSYPFIIATNGTADMLTAAGQLQATDGKVKFTLHFDEAIKQLTGSDPLQFEKLLPDLFYQSALNRFSFVRMPGLQVFTAYDANQFSYSIGPIMAGKKKTPLDLSQRFMNEEKLEKDFRPALLLYTDNIPFEVNLGESKPHFISMLPMGVHQFNRIKLAQRIAPFLNLISDEPTARRLIFVFKKIISSRRQPVYPTTPSGRRSLSPSLDQPIQQIFENVIVDLGWKSKQIFVTYENKEYEYLTEEDVFIEHPYLKEYAAYVQ